MQKIILLLLLVTTNYFFVSNLCAADSKKKSKQSFHSKKRKRQTKSQQKNVIENNSPEEKLKQFLAAIQEIKSQPIKMGMHGSIFCLAIQSGNFKKAYSLVKEGYPLCKHDVHQELVYSFTYHPGDEDWKEQKINNFLTYHESLVTTKNKK